MKGTPRFEWLLLRWLIIIGSIVLVLIVLTSCGRGKQLTSFQTVPLLEGDRAVGMRLLGVAIDQRRRDVYAIVGDKGTTLCAASNQSEVHTLH